MDRRAAHAELRQDPAQTCKRGADHDRQNSDAALVDDRGAAADARRVGTGHQHEHADQIESDACIPTEQNVCRKPQLRR
jgi:hypothetical protein